MSNEGMMFMIDQAKKLLGSDIQYSTVAGGPTDVPLLYHDGTAGR